MTGSIRGRWRRWARVATSPWVLSPLLVLALLAGGFAGYGAWTRSRPTHYSRGGPFAAVAGASPTAPADIASAAPRRASARPSTAPTATASQRASAAAAATGVSASGATTAPVTSAPPSSFVLPRTGRYAVRVSGSEHVRFGPFSACTNTFPAATSLIVSPANGEPAASYDFDQRFYPESANKHDERHIYRYTAGAVTLTYEEATVTCSGIKQSTTVAYSPAQTRLVLPLRVGASWHSEGGDSGRTEDATGQVVGTTVLTVGGRDYRTFVIDTHVVMSGSETGSRDQRWWWAPDLGMPLQWKESLSGSRSGASYREDVTCAVTSLPGG